MDHPLDGARPFNSADLEDALPVPSADETYAFSFTGTAANSKTAFSIIMQDAGPFPPMSSLNDSVCACQQVRWKSYT